MTGEGLTAFQVAVSEIFFELDESAGYVVAGGAALLSSDLITRSTQNLDLFAVRPSCLSPPPRTRCSRRFASGGGTRRSSTTIRCSAG